MNRAEAKDILNYDIRQYIKQCEDTTDEDLEALDLAIEALQDDWIPISERLPEDDEEVLVTVYFMGLNRKSPIGWNEHIKPSTYVETASRMDGEWYSDSDEYKIARNRHRVIAWKPLPKPYKADMRGKEREDG